MPKYTPPDYSDELTPKYWKKEKGVIAKIFAKKTGITEALEILEDSYQKYVQAASTAMQQQLPVDHVEAMEDKEYGDLADQFEKVAKLTKKWAEEWKPKTNPVPATTQKKVESMATEALRLGQVMRLSYVELQELAEEQQQATIDTYDQILTNAIDRAKTAVAEIEKQPDVETYNQYFKGGNGVGRKLTTALQSLVIINHNKAVAQKYITNFTPFGNGKLMELQVGSDSKVGRAISKFKEMLTELEKEL